jgi:prepilin-type N-terminal cleavage/methylation domain-containing protein
LRAALQKWGRAADSLTVTRSDGPIATPRDRESGFGLVEVLAAMTVLAIGILALFAMFESGIRHIKRASTVTTAGALADREIENFRAITYDSIGLPDSLVLAAPTPYAADPAYQSSAANRVALNACGTAPCTTKVPVQTLTGADGNSYRVDTYVTWQTIAGARAVKLVTVVVRDASDLSQVWARTASAFDESTGQ